MTIIIIIEIIIIVIIIVTFNSTFKCNIKGPMSSPPPTPKSELKIPTVNANSGKSKLNSAQLMSPSEIGVLLFHLLHYNLLLYYNTQF